MITKEVVPISDEVEINADSDEYEIVPMGPIRKLEKRLEKVESKNSLSGDESLIRDILDLMKSNQKIVDDMTENTNKLRNSVEDLTHKMDTVIDNMNEFMSILKEASEVSLEEDVSSEIGKSVIAPLKDEMSEINSGLSNMSENLERNNEQMAEGLEKLDKRLKRIYASQKKGKYFKGSKNQNR